MLGIRPTVKRMDLSCFYFLLLLTGGFISYLSSPLNAIKITGYVVALMGLLGLVFLWPLVSRARIAIAGTFCLLMGVATILPLIVEHHHSVDFGFLQLMSYPVVVLVLVLVGYRIACSKPRFLARYIAGLAFLNAAVAVSASLGILHALPIIGEIPVGRYIFGTTVPSSAGLNFNVNYFATAQGVFFWLYFGLNKIGGKQLKNINWVVLALIFLSSMIGSSRGVLLGLVVSITIYVVLTALLGPSRKERRRAFYTLLVTAVVFAGMAILFGETLHQALRVDRGLNYRDVIWGAGIELWLQKPFIGWGTGLAEHLGVMIDREGSAHSAYLSTLYRGGILLFFATYGFVVVSVLCGLGACAKKWYSHRWAIAVLVFALVNASVRSFSVGGLGLLPIAMGIALSVCYYGVENHKERGARLSG